jgi:hypothetical protein
MKYKVTMMALPLLLLGVGVAGGIGTNRALAWGFQNWNGGEENYWSQEGGSGYYQTCCGIGSSWGGGGGLHYRYLIGFQAGVQDAQAGNAYDCQIGYHTMSYCNGYSGYYSINNQQNGNQQTQEQQSSTSTSYSQSNPHITIYNVLPNPNSSDQGYR